MYVDNDPMVLVHARALLTGTPDGSVTYVHADLRQTDDVVTGAGLALDLTRPIGLMLLGIMGHTADDAQAHAIVRRLVDALPAGSYLVMTDGTDTDEASVESMRHYAKSGAVPYHLRSPEAFAAFFDGLEPVEPGIVSPPNWRPGPDDERAPDIGGRCAVARVP